VPDIFILEGEQISVEGLHARAKGRRPRLTVHPGIAAQIKRERAHARAMTKAAKEGERLYAAAIEQRRAELAAERKQDPRGVIFFPGFRRRSEYTDEYIGHSWWARGPAGPDAPHVLIPRYLYLIDRMRRHGWSRETARALEAKDWRPGNPSYGQCAVSVFVIQGLLGGDILKRFAILPDGTKIRHYVYRTPNGLVLDPTVDQFQVRTTFTEPTLVTEPFGLDVRRRALKLLANIDA